ncbi:MAG: GFA family protein, partial [Candidatus Afipia apatlaquensis]|nr:GFA family protein [Candidatus Afipia apatlaquensis]
MCQKAVAGPFACFVEIPHGDFAWTRGTPGTFRS